MLEDTSGPWKYPVSGLTLLVLAYTEDPCLNYSSLCWWPTDDCVIPSFLQHDVHWWVFSPGKGFSPHSISSYLFTFLFFISVGSVVILLNELQIIIIIIYFVLQIVPNLTSGNPFKVDYVLFMCPHHFCFFFFCTLKLFFLKCFLRIYFRFIFYFLSASLESAISPGSPSSLQWVMVFRSQDLGARCAHCQRVSLPPGQSFPTSAHLGLYNYLWWEAVPCIMGCSTASLTSTH